MGITDSELEKDRSMMNLHYFPLVFLLVITVDGAPKPSPKAAPNPKPDPKAKAQMAIIFNGGRGHTRRGNRYPIYDVRNDYGGGFENGRWNSHLDPWQMTCPWWLIRVSGGIVIARMELAGI